VPAEARLAFVICIRGYVAECILSREKLTNLLLFYHLQYQQSCTQGEEGLQLFRLRQINNGVFIKLNKATINILHLPAPYIAWGYPNLKSVCELIYKRGFVKINHQRIPITDKSD